MEKYPAETTSSGAWSMEEYPAETSTSGVWSMEEVPGWGRGSGRVLAGQIIAWSVNILVFGTIAIGSFLNTREESLGGSFLWFILFIIRYGWQKRRMAIFYVIHTHLLALFASLLRLSLVYRSALLEKISITNCIS